MTDQEKLAIASQRIAQLEQRVAELSDQKAQWEAMTNTILNEFAEALGVELDSNGARV